MANPGVSLDNLMQSFREEVRRWREQNAIKMNVTSPVARVGGVMDGSAFVEAFAVAEKARGVGRDLPPMTCQRGIKRPLAMLVARIVLRLAQIITRDQRTFNYASLAALRAMHEGLDWQAARVSDLEGRAQALGQTLAAQARTYDEALAAVREQLGSVSRQQAEVLQVVREHISRLELTQSEAMLHGHLEALREEVRAEIREQGERIVKETFSASEHWTGPRGREGLWFNEPISIRYDHGGRASWSGTNERIIERVWIIRHLSSIPTGSRVLDVGCSESFLSLELASNGFLVTGIDVRPYPLRHPNFQFIQADICDSKLESESYDAAIALSTIEHLGLGWYGDHPGESVDHVAMKEIYRMLKPGGRLIVTVPFGALGRTPLHRIYDRKSLGALLRDFVIEKIDYGIKVDARTWVSPATEEEASQQRHDPVSYAPSALAMVLCLKPLGA